MKPPAEFKVMRVRECLAPADLVDTPERAYQYWKANILTAPWFDPAKEAFVVLILNTRRRIIGHNLVAPTRVAPEATSPPHTPNLRPGSIT